MIYSGEVMGCRRYYESLYCPRVDCKICPYEPGVRFIESLKRGYRLWVKGQDENKR